MKLRIHILIALFCCSLCSIAAQGQLRLPRLISNGMVLQRGAPVKIWGWAAPNERVSMQFKDSSYHTAANPQGEWELMLSTMNAGGPYTMSIMASDTIVINDIAVGDVWVCSGQSNMELPMSRVSPIYGDVIAHSNNHDIRQFAVPQKYDFNVQQHDLRSGGWTAATPSTVLGFSAAAYFFARELYEKYHVPIGLINTSLGGSPVQAWISEEALKQFPVYYAEAQKFKDTTLIVSIDSADRARSNEWYTLLRQKDEGYANAQRPWSSPAVNTSGWPVMTIPGYWNATSLGAVNGVVWFQRDVTIPARMAGKQAALTLGRIVDADSVFVNGTFVGTTGYQYPPRRYTIPKGILKAGTNSIVVRVISNFGNGGFVYDKQYEIVADGQRIDLKGPWHYKLGAVMAPLAGQTFVRWKSAGLFNAMLSPLLKYRIKGAIWYQGESNAGKPAEYRDLLTALITDWRTQWKQGDFPFLIMQLPNFMESKPEPTESNWALLREAQLKTLAVPNTGLAVGIDIGEWNDIHPLNKKDVGRRLALAAEKIAYGDTNVVSSGPVYHSMKIEKNKAIVSFTNIGSGLQIRGGKTVRGFAIADSTGKFVFARAEIRKNTVVVYHPAVAHPVAVRYAWADNPAGANLYNKEGLPASPFRTDEWPAK
jgi:sialate O-acetylesterase